MAQIEPQQRKFNALFTTYVPVNIATLRDVMAARRVAAASCDDAVTHCRSRAIRRALAHAKSIASKEAVKDCRSLVDMCLRAASKWALASERWC